MQLIPSWISSILAIGFLCPCSPVAEMSPNIKSQKSSISGGIHHFFSILPTLDYPTLQIKILVKLLNLNICGKKSISIHTLLVNLWCKGSTLLKEII